MVSALSAVTNTASSAVVFPRVTGEHIPFCQGWAPSCPRVPRHTPGQKCHVIPPVKRKFRQNFPADDETEKSPHIYKNNGLYNSIYTATTFHDVPGQPEYQFATLNIIIPCSQGDRIDIRSDAVSNLTLFYICSHFNVEFIQ